MHDLLLFLHAATKWFVVTSLPFSILYFYISYRQKKPITKLHNQVKNTTLSIVHIQLLLGILLYGISPITNYFWDDVAAALSHSEIYFFGGIHFISMVIAVIIITIGNLEAKRATSDRQYYNVLLIFWSIGFLIILCAIPWPFSPFVTRPWFRFY